MELYVMSQRDEAEGVEAEGVGAAVQDTARAVVVNQMVLCFLDVLYYVFLKIGGVSVGPLF